MLLVNLIISVPNVLEFVGRNTLAVIGYIDSNLFTDYLLGNNNRFVLARIVNSVIYKVVYNLRNFQFVGFYKYSFLAFIKINIISVLLLELCISRKIVLKLSVMQKTDF